LIKLWHDNINLWDDEKMPRENLERILRRTFPSPQTTQKDELNLECGICYAYSLPPDNVPPDSVCDNAKCGRSYHQSCLYDWLKCIPTTVHSYNTVFGVCPYCSEKMSVALPSKHS
jgi:E3 ubiquitin-protein ligase FANCL